MYILFCEFCRAAYSYEDKISKDACPKCGGRLVYSGMRKEEWDLLNESQKQALKDDFFAQYNPTDDSDMIVSSTDQLEGYSIEEYLDFITEDMLVCFGTDEAIAEIKGKIIANLKNHAKRLGANAIVGTSVSVSFCNGFQMLCSAAGTAVRVEEE